MNFCYVCTECNKQFEIKAEMMVCPECSKKQEADKPIRGILEVELSGKVDNDFEVIDLLPVERQYFSDIPVGNTPLQRSENLCNTIGFKNLYLKNDTLNPTGSLKDRASYLVAAFAKREGIKNIVVASTGNAASSMAGVGASAGLDITIFVPKAAPPAKLVQSLQYGARVITVDGNYDMAFDMSMEYSAKAGGLSRNTAYNPLTIEGKKTVAIEIFKQLGNKIPDYLFVSTGDGVIVGGIFKGFCDLVKLGLTDKMPTIYAIQAEGSDSIARAVENGDFDPIDSVTLADSIAVDIPKNGYYALKQIKEHHGRCVRVTDDEILDAQKFLSEKSGLFSEPAGAAAYAGFNKVKDDLPKDALITLVITGNGLKDIDNAKKRISMPKKHVKDISELI